MDARPIEANGEELLLAMGGAGGGELRDERTVRWTIGGSPIDYHNAVVAADLTAEDADRVIGESVARFRARGVPGSWHVGPSMRPTDIADRLTAHGFRDDGEEVGMALALAEAPAVPQPDGLRIERVSDEEGLEAYGTVLSRGFGEGPREASWVRQTFARIGLGDDVPWRHVVGTLDEEPVATSSLFVHEAVGGIAFVATVPEARRRGFGSAVTMATVREARHLGCRLAVLAASPMGSPVYRRLGFREGCRIRILVWDQT